jgi:hypothetical protein
MEFFDINLTEELSLLLLAIHNPFYWRILKENHTLVYKTFCEARKVNPIHE